MRQTQGTTQRQTETCDFIQVVILGEEGNECDDFQIAVSNSTRKTVSLLNSRQSNKRILVMVTGYLPSSW